jgi:hypothetical protein
MVGDVTIGIECAAAGEPSALWPAIFSASPIVLVYDTVRAWLDTARQIL